MAVDDVAPLERRDQAARVRKCVARPANGTAPADVEERVGAGRLERIEKAALVGAVRADR
jgi:hypothetical protein